MDFQFLNPDQCRQMLATDDMTLLDIRDPQSFAAGHIQQAIHIEAINIDDFVESQPKDKALVICCYHGNSSQSAAQFFAEKGFTNVYSLNGGYEGWQE